ncbi:hypothetical protein AGMMS49991_01520 [Spirochaetia bacterium]|nr:hypothetical protein AGMMS49991_01520 [Spirochaetia bacterium]
MMKNFFGSLVLITLILSPLSAQSSYFSGEMASPFEARSFYYQVISDAGSSDAAAIVRELELRFNFYNRIFRYNTSALTSPLRVRAFHDRQSYDTYVSSQLGSTRPGAVYLHYDQSDRRELVIHRGSPGERENLPREAFIQFFRAFVANPPAWLREGFGVYFSTLRYSDILEELTYTENLTLLDTVRELGADAPSLELVLLADTLGIPENFTSIAWSLVSFFLNNGKEEYFRTMAEIFMTLSNNFTARQNAELTAQRISLWIDISSLHADYNEYINARKTFIAQVKNGQEAYSAKDFVTAQICFSTAVNLRPDQYVPYYYLGLITYENRDHSTADSYYRMALERGANEDIVSYARGVNAMAAGRNADAIRYLENAARISPAIYRDRVAELLQRLR